MLGVESAYHMAKLEAFVYTLPSTHSGRSTGLPAALRLFHTQPSTTADGNIGVLPKSGCSAVKSRYTTAIFCFVIGDAASGKRGEEEKSRRRRRARVAMLFGSRSRFCGPRRTSGVFERRRAGGSPYRPSGAHSEEAY